MRFDQLEEVARTEIHDSVRNVAVAPAAKTRRTRPVVALTGAAVAVVAVVLVAAALQSGGESGPAAPASTTIAAPTTLPSTTTEVPPTKMTTTVPDEAALGGGIGLWSIEDPAGWHRTTHVGDDVTVITYSSVALGTEAPGCAGIPDGALDRIGDTDALLTIALTSSDAALQEWTGEPDLDPLGVATDPCLGTLADRTFTGVWLQADARVEVKVLAIGLSAAATEVTPTGPGDLVPAELIETVASLRFDAPHEARGFSCVSTRASEPGFTPPEGYPPVPSVPEDRWYGTADLWAPLPVEADYGPRKSVWWSVNFPGGAAEERPEIAVTWHRLDVDSLPHTHDEPGTNASTPQDGWFMIAGIDPDERGCWEVTATYKGATLSYVYANTWS